MTGTKGKGEAHKFLVDHVNHQGEACLIWPFSLTRGYGALSHLGRRGYAHRFMCELAHGEPPSDVHEAAHSCGNNSCVNPRHLSWKTPAENMLDCREHGTHIRSRYGNTGKITAVEAAEIRALRGVKTLWEIAGQFGVSESTVSNIWVGRTHSKPRNLPPRWSAEDDANLREAIERGLTFRQASQAIGRPYGAVNSRAARLGIKSQWKPAPSSTEREAP